MAEAYGTEPAADAPFATARRHTFVIDPDGRVARVYRVKDIKGHPDEVLADIRQLQRSRTDTAG